MKNIIIAGAGFGGVTVALKLGRVLRGATEARVILTDREAYQLFYPNLYELASSDEELTSLLELKHSITVPVREILRGKDVEFIQGALDKVDIERSEVVVAGKSIHYDYLILSLGSVSNFYGIPGAQDYAIPLKSANDALRMRDKVEFAVQSRRYDMAKQYVRVAVAGGGFAGVETAAELQKFLDFVAWKNNFPREKIETLLIEGTDRILPGLDDRVARDVYARLHDLGVRVQVSSFISGVDANFLQFKNGEKLEYDCLVWTAGVKAAPAPFFGSGPASDRGGRILVDQFLHPAGPPNVYVIGDQACVIDSSGRPLIGNISNAEDQAFYVADSVASVLAGRTPKPFSCRRHGYIIPVGGKWAVVKTPGIYIKGWLGYVIRELVFLRYFAGIIGWSKALRLAWFDEQIYSKKD